MDNDPAFPGQCDHNSLVESWTGISIRDYFAAKAMGLSYVTSKDSCSIVEVAELCYEMADAMMEARK